MHKLNHDLTILSYIEAGVENFLHRSFWCCLLEEYIVDNPICNEKEVQDFVLCKIMTGKTLVKMTK